MRLPGARRIAGCFVLALSTLFPMPASTAEEQVPVSPQVVPISPNDTPAQIIAKAAQVVPSPRQLAWQRQELTAFVHFGVNTFTGREIGTGQESPEVFQPDQLDTDQWMNALRDAGFRKVIFTAKHHDGFLLYPSHYSGYGVAASSWRAGKGDVVRAFTDSARKFGLAVGIYLSPADLHEALPGGRYGNGSRAVPTSIPENPADSTGRTFPVTADDYNRYYLNTLYELLTRYGKVDEVWFDGFNPIHGKSQTYDFPDWIKLVRALQPEAVMFGGVDLRWVGNEDGTARTGEFSVLPFHGKADGAQDLPTVAADESAADLGSDAVLAKAGGGDFLKWAPAECDARLESTWFWHPNQPPKSLDSLVDMYFDSVGRNCQLLLDVPPDDHGRFTAADVARLHEFGARISGMFAHDLVRSTSREPDGSLVAELVGTKRVEVVSVAEDLRAGQRVTGFEAQAWNGCAWYPVATGTAVGNKRLLRLSKPVDTSRLRVHVTSARAAPMIKLGAYG
ncbi:alpha-L-fucosidase [Kutzneria albida]|uniref:alpha-L-fucosidase n=1 Tax=Kutzneria albida DSM 43870 TaxID=1449976 RepID=W5W1S9_9PSEU|nr:alpha-L-fucosidase [Kutzneria albida]AHH94740.1 alpha-1,3/4-fucosidase [Kutzneria albida DSM 43870]